MMIMNAQSASAVLFFERMAIGVQKATEPCVWPLGKPGFPGA